MSKANRDACNGGPGIGHAQDRRREHLGVGHGDVAACGLRRGRQQQHLSLKLSNVSGATLPKSSVVGIIHPDVYVTGSALAFADVVIDPSGTTAYLTVPAKNEVAVLNLKTGAYRKPVAVGSDPQDIDITPDGTTLYPCDAGGQTISKVVIATRKVTRIITPSSFTHDTPIRGLQDREWRGYLWSGLLSSSRAPR